MAETQDMFTESQTQRVTRVPHTPSQTPSRSVKRRPYNVSRTPKLNYVPKREAVTCYSKSQPLRYDDFYDLRTRQVPISNSVNDFTLLAPYGIYDNPPKNKFDEPEEQTPIMNSSKDQNRRKTLGCLFNVFGFGLLMLLSGFIGAFCYAYVNHHFLMPSTCRPQLQLTQNMTVERPIKTDVETVNLENSISHLSEELKALKDRIINSQEHFKDEVVQNNQKGVLEELLTADIACAGNLGSVLATPDTTTLTVPITVTLLGIFSFESQMVHRPPHISIQGLIQDVGDCWAFLGSRGRLVLKLQKPSLVTGVSISQIPSSLRPTGDITSTPRHTQLWAHEAEEDLEHGLLIRDFEYNSSGPWRQNFPVDPSITKEKLFDIVEFRFLENYGNPNYTCIYRVHVHGRMP